MFRALSGLRFARPARSRGRVLPRLLARATVGALALAVGTVATIPAYAVDPCLTTKLDAERCAMQKLGGLGSKGAAPAPGLGELKFHTFDRQRLNDRMQLQVNVVNGNLVLHTQDLKIRGTGLDLILDRFYNSRSSAITDLGSGWSFGAGRDVFLTAQGDGSVTFTGLQSYVVTFRKNADGSYAKPPGINAKLTTRTGGGYELKFHETDEKLVFAEAASDSWLMTSDTDRNGNDITYTYDALDRLTAITDTQNRVTRFGYYPDNSVYRKLVSTVTDPAGRVHRYVYDNAFNLVVYVNPLDQRTYYAYDRAHNLTAIIDPVGHATWIGYDAASRAVSVTYDANRPDKLQALRDELDKCRQWPPQDPGLPGSTELEGLIQQCAEVAAVAQNATQPPLGGDTTTYRYDPVAEATLVIDPRRGGTVYSYNSEARVTDVTDQLGRSRKKTYTPAGNVASYTDSLSAVTTLSYNTNDSLEKIQAPGSQAGATGTSTSFGYGDATHPYQPTSQTDPQGNQQGYKYDVAGNLDTTTNQLPSQNVSDRDYNANGTLKTRTDPRGKKTFYGYDSVGNLTSIDRPAPLGDKRITVDALSRVATVTDGRTSAAPTATTRWTGSSPSPTRTGRRLSTPTTATATSPSGRTAPGPPPSATTSATGSWRRPSRTAALSATATTRWATSPR